MIGIGIIGCGGRSREIARQLLDQGKQFKVVAINDPSDKSIECSLEQLDSNAVIYEDYHDLIKDPQVNWVMIGSWNFFHAEQAIAAMQAGKNIFCEKPLATNIKDCIDMQEALNKSGVKFVIGFTLRYSEFYNKIKSIIDSGQIGKIVSMEFNETLGFNHGAYIHQDWRRFKKWAGTHLLEKCCHDIDLLIWMVNSLPSKVASFGGVNFFKPENDYLLDKLDVIRAEPDAEVDYEFMAGPPIIKNNPFIEDKDIIDNQVAIIEFANNVRATFHTNCSTSIKERRMFIIGTEGTIRADCYTSMVEVQKLGWDEPVESYDMTRPGGHGGSDPILVKELALAMLNKEEPKSKLQDGLVSAFTCFGIDQAMDESRVVDMQSIWKMNNYV